MSLDEKYRDYFIRNLHDALSGHRSYCVDESVQFSEESKMKCIGITIETRPDYCQESHIKDLLVYGCTRLEIGVQSIYEEYFENPDFRPDGLKIYPTLVIRGTGLYELWKNGKYRNYHPDKLVEIVAKILAYVPPWTRVYRIQRDIPMPLVTSGVDNGNLRELVL